MNSPILNLFLAKNKMFSHFRNDFRYFVKNFWLDSKKKLPELVSSVFY